MSTSENGESWTPSKTLIQDIFVRLEKWSAGQPLAGAVPSGVEPLDTATGGFKPGQLTIAAARSDEVRSAFLHQCVLQALQVGAPTVLYTPMEARWRVGLRFLTRRAELDLQRVERDDFDEQEWADLVRAAGFLAEAPLVIDTRRPLTRQELRDEAHLLNEKRNLGLLVVDSLQFIRPKSPHDDLPTRVDEAAHTLRELALDLELPVLAGCLVRRPQPDRPEPRTRLIDLLAGDQLESCADLILALTELPPPHDYTRHRLMRLELLKHLDGPAIDTELRFDSARGIFSDWG